MRSLWSAVLVVLLFSPLAALASDYTEFRIPRHTWRSFSADGFGSLSRDDQDVLGGQSMTTNRLGRLSSNAVWGLDSDILAAFARVVLSADESRRRVEEAPRPLVPGDQNTREGTSNTTQAGWSLSGLTRLYPWESSFHAGISARVSGDYLKTSFNDYSEVHQAGPPSTLLEVRDDRSNWNRFHTVSYSLSAGLGRVRDATSVHRVHVLEARLRRAGILDRGLSRSARQALANLFYTEPAFAIVHDRPARFFWRELERILIEDGAIDDAGLDAFSTILAQEGFRLVDSVPFMRRVGYTLSLAVEGAHHKSDGRYDSSSLTQSFVADTLSFATHNAARDDAKAAWDEVLVGPNLAAHYPVSHRVQFDVTAGLRSDTRDGGAYSYSTEALLTYLMADRWEANARLNYLRRRGKESPSGTPSRWLTGYSASISYYLEDRTRVTLQFFGVQSRATPIATNEGFRRNQEIQLGITYFFLRGLDAPGLFAPQRMLPPTPPLAANL